MRSRWIHKASPWVLIWPPGSALAGPTGSEESVMMQSNWEVFLCR
ncbi:hypothetical protein AG1IA_04704 [Rhizoctonia solani AG-1 IA]|uniref:Uncharacterized protein n=1 Tax=Thanatephorus cucumeris (strain AG1-IA) TaxID=983506 RepID=L8WTH7_THACA|nr:hypothetical protein AG1IA_04704 [Rhizoctonia solani AG-1 IA]